MSSARVAKVFQMDPAEVYTEQDAVRWLVRVAAYKVIARDDKAAAAEAKRR